MTGSRIIEAQLVRPAGASVITSCYSPEHMGPRFEFPDIMRGHDVIEGAFYGRWRYTGKGRLLKWKVVFYFPDGYPGHGYQSDPEGTGPFLPHNPKKKPVRRGWEARALATAASPSAARPPTGTAETPAGPAGPS